MSFADGIALGIGISIVIVGVVYLFIRKIR